MEALNNVEQSYQKVLRAHSNSKQQPTPAKSNTSFAVSVSFQLKTSVTQSNQIFCDTMIKVHYFSVQSIVF